MMRRDVDSALPVAPGDVVGRYRLEHLLGRGGMGFVVAAREIHTGTLVAIKLLLPTTAARPDYVERFLREARASSALESEHATRVLEVGTAPPSGLPFMVMEHLEGATLAALVQRGRVPVGHAAAFIAQACEALEEAHSLGIVHRDIKPDNLFVTRRRDGSPFVKVLDFGISQIAKSTPENERLTGTADIMGTPLYMAPEQMRSARAAEPRSDVWALGATLFELLTGEVPFPGSNVTEICTHVLTGEPKSPRTLRPAIPRALESIVLRCLDKKPEKRFQSARDLRIALAPFVYKPAPDDADVSPRQSRPETSFAATAMVDADTALVRRPRATSTLLVSAAAIAVVGLTAVLTFRWLSGARADTDPSSAAGTAMSALSASPEPLAPASATPSDAPSVTPAPATATLAPPAGPAPSATLTVSPKPSHRSASVTPPAPKPPATGRFKDSRR